MKQKFNLMKGGQKLKMKFGIYEKIAIGVAALIITALIFGYYLGAFEHTTQCYTWVNGMKEYCDCAKSWCNLK